MARPNRNRTVNREGILAERIRYERERKNWSPAQLAQAMTANGCSIQTSAIYRIEETDPAKRRRITVDELVTLASVFGVTVENMLRSTEDVRIEALDAIFQHRDEAMDRLFPFVRDLMDVYTDFFEIAASRPDEWDEYENAASDYFDRCDQEVRIFSVIANDGTMLDVSDQPLVQAVVNLHQVIMETASEAVKKLHGVITSTDSDAVSKDHEHGEH